MEGKTHRSDKQVMDQSTYTTVLANWFEAVSTFYNHYNQLRPYAAQISTQKGPNDARPVDRGQCPVGQLKRLLVQMQQELDVLTQDMNQIDTPDTGCTHQQYRKLANHTSILTKLNQRAQTMSLLINLSAS